MQDLTPVGLSPDGKRLVLLSSRGVEFAVLVDEALTAAMRGDQDRAPDSRAPEPQGQLEMKMESTLRPRDIQARIRSGETAEAVAEAAGSSVEKIMIYAGPVLAERAHIAQSAQLASIRRKSADSSAQARTLSDAAPPYFRSVGMRPDDVDWDAWRRDDGRWTLVATFDKDGTPTQAKFTYDMPGRYVTADDDEARLLTGEAQPAHVPAPPADGRRLTAVPSPQDELPLGDDLGDDALEMVREHGAHPTASPDDLTEDHADADWIAPPPPDNSSADEVTAEIHVDGAAPVDEPTDQASWLDETFPEDEAADDEAQPAAEVEDPTEDAHEEPAHKPKKKGRAQVPSWDEIMFGGGKAD